MSTSDPLFAQLYSNPRSKLATAEDLIASMNRDGIDVSVALNISWTSPEMCSATNDYIIQSMASYPGRLVGFCSLPLNQPEAALQELERCAKAGIKGVGEIRLDDHFFNSSSRREIKPIIETIIRNEMVFLLHSSEPVGHSYAGKGNITPDRLFSLISAYPELTVVCAARGVADSPSMP